MSQQCRDGRAIVLVGTGGVASPVLTKRHNFSRGLAAPGGRRVQGAHPKIVPTSGCQRPQRCRDQCVVASVGVGVASRGLRKGHNLSRGLTAAGGRHVQRPSIK